MYYMVIDNPLLCLPSWAGPCRHGMNHRLQPCWLRNSHSCHCGMGCQRELRATAKTNVVFIAHASMLVLGSTESPCSLRAQCQHQTETSAYQCTTPRLGCPAEMQCSSPRTRETPGSIPITPFSVSRVTLTGNTALCPQQCRTNSPQHIYIIQQVARQTAGWEIPGPLVSV